MKASSREIGAAFERAQTPQDLAAILAMALRGAAIVGDAELYVMAEGRLQSASSGGAVPVPPASGQTRLLERHEGLTGDGREWLVLESQGEIVGAVAIGVEPRPMNSGERRTVVELGSELARALLIRRHLAERAAHDQLTWDLDVAREVQAVLSRPIPALRGVQVAARTRPVREVTGDFFDVLEVEGNRIGLLVGDVAGRGVPSALLMAASLSFFRSMAPGASSPRQVLETVNALILRHRPSARLYVSALYAVYDCRDKTLAIANAGMPAPILNGRQLALKGLPLGAKETPGYREDKIPLTSGDVLVLMSDGLNTARADGRKLGWERLIGLVGDYLALSAGALLDQLLAETEQWSAGALADDMTAVCLRVGDGGPGQKRIISARTTRKLVVPASGMPGK